MELTHQPESRRLAALHLILASFIVLFQEMALIRWLPSQVRVIAYFPNVVLIAAFLGLGIGCLRAGKRSLLWMWPASLLALTLAAVAMSRIAFTHESETEHLWLLYFDIPKAPVVHGVRLPIIVLFILTMLSFVPLGQFVAERLRTFRRGGSLWGYAFDLLGSLLGVIGFAVASFWLTFPVVWFAVFVIGGIALLWHAGWITSPRRVGMAACAIVPVLLVAWTERADRYSPYYALTYVEPEKGRAGGRVLTNGSFHQYPTFVARGEPLPNIYDNILRDGYHEPYARLSRPPGRVLVLGAGTGNDVAVALDQGAEQVDVVEIDPEIIRLGREHHPNRPYDLPRVRIINDDARSYLNRTSERYDLIVFGTLDSMTRLSALSSVRLDNFVYTAECLRSARDRLSDDGGLIMYFMVQTDYIDRRLVGIVYDAFGEEPLVLRDNFWMFSHALMAGPAFAAQREQRDAASALALRRELDREQTPTDDWPFLYLRNPGISGFYLILLGSFGLIALGGVYVAAPNMLRLSPRGGGFDAEMFLFGAAFLLLETKSVTEMNLVWGVTWLTSAVVIGAVLATLLLSTILMQLRPMPWWLSVTGLVISLLVSYATPTSVLLGHGTAMTLLLSLVFVGLPIFFASTCFALRFRTRSAPDIAFGWNLLGTVAGGALEFLSMAIGFRALSIVALGAYALAFAFVRTVPPQSTVPIDGAQPSDAELLTSVSA